MENIQLVFPGEPKAIQSVRFSARGGFARKFQPKANTDWKGYLRLCAVDQLPEEWETLKGPLAVDAEFCFAPLRSMAKRDQARLAEGWTFYKPTRPDLCDNLMKGLCDALTGVVWQDDAQICRVASVKRFDVSPCIRLRVRRLNAAEEPMF